MRRYIWQLPDWPGWQFEASALLGPIARANAKRGELNGIMRSAGFAEKQEAQLEALTQDAVKTSEIEGERFDPHSVRSSVARRLGLPEGGLPSGDAKMEGVVEVTLDATQKYDQPLTESRLCTWHRLLFPLELGTRKPLARIGAWRDDAKAPMRVVSGPLGRERIHYEAPPARRVRGEMRQFLKWYALPPEGDGLLRSAIAHLWFLTIHPFEDGNGRIARAVADMALSHGEGSAVRFFSMSRQISVVKNEYYDVLERTQSADSLDITPWLL